MWVFIKMKDGSFNIGYPINETEYDKSYNAFITRYDMQWVFKTDKILHAILAVNYLNGGHGAGTAGSFEAIVSNGIIEVL